MSIRNLQYLFNPASVALIGASERTGSVGATVLRNLLAGGFQGAIYPVNPRHAQVAGQRCWAKDAQAALYEAAILSEKTALDTARAGLLGDIQKRGTVYGR